MEGNQSRDFATKFVSDMEYVRDQLTALIVKKGFALITNDMFINKLRNHHDIFSQMIYTSALVAVSAEYTFYDNDDPAADGGG